MRILKFTGSTIIGVASIILFFIALTYKTFWVPFLLGLLGLSLLLLISLDIASFKKDWKPYTIIGITGFVFIFSASLLFCDNYNGPLWLFNILQKCALTALILDIVMICTVIILLIYKKIKNIVNR